MKKQFEGREHARLAAKRLSKKGLIKHIDAISKRLYENKSSAVPSDLGLFKAANQRDASTAKIDFDKRHSASMRDLRNNETYSNHDLISEDESIAKIGQSI